jgi:uncharacterized protein involved in exopolysaccharide biosynthesis
MDKPLKFNHEKRTEFLFERSGYFYYEDFASRILPSIVRHGRLIASCVLLALVFATFITPLLPRKYSSEALIYLDMLSNSDQGKVVPLANVDGVAIVNGEVQLIRSDAILREVARTLEQDPNASGSRSPMMFPFDWFRAAWLPETRNYSPFDRVVAMLRRKIVVMNETRSYLISISYTASSAEEAAKVVNAVVTQYLREKVKQRRLIKVVAAETELRQQLAVYGEKHPKTLQAMAELDAGRASLEAAMKSQDGDQYEVANIQSVKLAVPNHTPTSPKGLAIFGLSILSALLAGIGLAVWHGFRQMEINQTEGERANATRVEVEQAQGKETKATQTKGQPFGCQPNGRLRSPEEI